MLSAFKKIQMNSTFKIAFAFLLLFSFTFSNAQTNKAEEDKIHVSITDKESAFKKIKVETIVHASVEEIVAFVTEVSGYKDWMFKCRDSKMLEAIEKNDYIYYVEIDMPYPTTDRDVVIHSNYEWAADGKSFHLVSSAENDYLAHNDDFVRVEELETEWKLTEITPGKTSVIHLNRINPAGNLPHWMHNLAAEIGPMKTVKKLKKALDKPSYTR